MSSSYDQTTDNLFVQLAEQIPRDCAARILQGQFLDAEELAAKREYDFSACFAVGICIGIRPDLTEKMVRHEYQKYILLRSLIEHEISSWFQQKKNGFLAESNLEWMLAVGIFPVEYRTDFEDRYICPLIKSIEKKYKTELCVGIGMPAVNREQIKNACETAKEAFNLYFFQEKKVLRMERCRRNVSLSLDDYYVCAAESVRAILMKAPDVLARIDRVVEIIGKLHYGNRMAVRMHLMNYTGELSNKLRRYRLTQQDFFEMQNELQERVLNAAAMREIRRSIHDYYRRVLGEIYQKNRPSSKAIVERVENYIQDHYMEELSIKELSEIACVSTSYFSHMFKNETGINYKVYLTDIRLKRAEELLLESDYRLYEICEKVGYHSVRTFVDAFKQKYSMSPLKYKKAIAAGKSVK